MEVSDMAEATAGKNGEVRHGPGGWNKGIKGSTRRKASVSGPVAELVRLGEEMAQLDARRAEIDARRAEIERQIQALRPHVERLAKLAGITST